MNESLLTQAHEHLVAGRHDVAVALCRAVLAIDPDQTEARAILRQLGETGPRLDERVPPSLREAWVARAAGADLEGAEREARRFVVCYPGDVFAHKALGLILVRRRHHAEALAVLERALVCDATDPEIHDGIATALLRLGRAEDALRHYRRALEIAPDQAKIHYNLGLALHELGQLDEALACYARAHAIDPGLLLACNNAGNACIQLGRLPQATDWFNRVLARDPCNVQSLNNLASVQLRARLFETALETLERVLALDPDHVEALNNRGNAFAALDRLGAAQQSYLAAIRIRPDYAEAYCNLGNTFELERKPQQAIDCYRQALVLKPDLIEAHLNLGNSLRDLDRLGEARACYEQALELQPDYPGALHNLGCVLQDLGDLDASIAVRLRARELAEDPFGADSSLLFTLNYHPDRSVEAIRAAYQDFEYRHAAPARVHRRAYANPPDPERRLRVGYVSPDFRSHAIRYMLEPLLECHDQTQFELYAYAELTRQDAQTARYQGLVDHWVPTRGLSDAELDTRIRADGIDILVDLAGHTAGNRLRVFTRKPAPVSVSLWVGYGYTSGLSAIDYFLCDEVLVPEGAEELFSERPWRIATPAGMYRPSEGMGAVNVLPALERGYITFGTLTRGVRVNHRTIRVWSEILERVPGSRLVVDSRTYADPLSVESLTERFAAHGIGGERLEIGYHSPPWDVLRGMDIGLDCFPHNSGTT
ncbi:tetratricopeptide repeat protein, partial [Marichromatium sp. AB31]|uniref:tetratricopeptide repeat protein n=1 Tax=Marichromatium sp. AB31 TaxID=2483362 RepID=UPI000F3DCDC1